jgi:imidazolonepropionase-like amidohydrolase
MQISKVKRSLAGFVFLSALAAQSPLTPGLDSKFRPGLNPFLAVDAPVVALDHVRVIDGTGAAPLEDQTIVIENGKILSTGPAGQVTVPAGAKRIDLANHTVFPGIVGMHEHFYYPSPPGSLVALYIEQEISYPRLYLASGVTTARTAGGHENYTDLNLKRLIQEGKMPGPKISVTAGYLEGKGPFVQMAQINTPDDARRFVEYWASMGADSFKAYTHLTRAELKAALDAAHARGLKITGHLCSIGFREAVALGIDQLEHGINTDSEFNPQKQPDVCPGPLSNEAMAALDMNGEPVQAMIRDLVSHHVPITSTLAVLEYKPKLQQRFLDALSATAALDYLAARERMPAAIVARSLLDIKKEDEFEQAFVKAGGLLVAGSDPTGQGGTLAGFGDQREIEMLVEGGFRPVDAIKIATLNGAKVLGMDASIGSVSAGKQADLVVVSGNPVTRIEDVENVEIVFRDGLGFDSKKLLDSVHGLVGLH